MFVDMIPWKTKDMEKIARAFLPEEKLILIRAPAGMGKTSVAMAFLFWSCMMGKRGAIFLRTRREVEHCLSIAERINRTLKLDILIIPTPSKRELCVMGLGEDIPIRFMCPAVECERLNRRKYSDIEKALRGTVIPSMRSYIHVLSRGGRCPYIIMKALLPKADIIVGVHEYFSDPYLFSLLGKLDICIIDEAHGFILMHNEFDKDRIEKGRLLVDEFYERGGRNVGRLIVSLWRRGERDDAISVSQYYQYMQSRGVEVEVDGKIFKIPTPLSIIKERLTRLEKLIVMSSTLYPSRFFEVLFSKGISHKIFVFPGLMKSPTRRLFILDTILSTRHSERSRDVYIGYAKIIRRIKKRHNSKIIVFTPSYDVARGIARALNARVTDAPMGEDIIVTVYRGRIAEGVEIPEGYNVAVMAGLPYPKVTERTLRVLAVYSREYGIDFETLKNAYINSSMISALVQAMGRVGRKGRVGHVYVVDRRAKGLFGVGNV